MKRFVVLTTIVLCAGILLCSAKASAGAACTINVFGIVLPDTDCDGVVDITDNNDYDGDGLPDGDPVDNCPLVPNGDCVKDPVGYCDIDASCSLPTAPLGCMPSAKEIAAGDQVDWNRNGIGDACDDTDQDGVLDYLDTCRSTYNPDQDPGACTDTDHDTIEDPVDNCPEIYNPNQMDIDADVVGDACDNCPYAPNPTQDPDACAPGVPAPALPSISGQAAPGGSGGGVGVALVEESIQGNGFSDGGGCTLCAEARGSAAPAFLFLIAAILLVAQRRRRHDL